MSSSDETEASSEMGTGRSYECVFCKRGFTTAQALGGHMNIHRKDRPSSAAAKPNNKPIPTNHNNYRPNNYDYAFHHHSSTFPLHHYPSRPAAHAFFPSAESGEAHVYVQAPPAYLDLFGENSWRIRTTGDQMKEKEYEVVAGGDQGDVLDLELRLGHHAGGGGRQY